MNKKYSVTLLPLGVTRHVAAGTPLKSVLGHLGMEFPCGGRGTCRGCRIKVLAGALPVATDGTYELGAEDLAEGWRLACRHTVEQDLTLEVSQWHTPVLVDNSHFEFTPDEGYGIAVDLGSTTLAVQLLDLRTARVLGVGTSLNPQARHGADIMSRITFALEGGQPQLQQLIREEIGALLREVIGERDFHEAPLKKVTIVGNTPMHNLFCGVDVRPLSHYPFIPTADGLLEFTPAELGWALPGQPVVQFLPSLGSFVGSDILGGLLATRMPDRDEVAILIDLGTNGEIVVGNRERMVCASTAAGPAFEAANISMGMRAAPGAITEVRLTKGRFVCTVLGDVAPAGICGSGLVDAVAAALEAGLINPAGRIADGRKEIMLSPPVKLMQQDIRELQLAKAATAVGVRLLLKRLGYTPEDVTALYLAGAFGNYIRLGSALRIGLLQLPRDKIIPSGNTALLGAKIALFLGDGAAARYADVRRRVAHVSLNTDLEFMESYVDEMGFPEACADALAAR